MLINISEIGTVSFVHDDELAGLLSEGRSAIRRASNVEPNPDGTWSADLAPVSGPVLGPFKLRREALAAEVSWIERNVLGGES